MNVRNLLLVLLSIIFFSTNVIAKSDVNINIALYYIKNNYKEIGLEELDIKDLKLKDIYFDDFSSINRIWFQQYNNYLPLKNGFIGVHIKDGQVVQVTNNGKANLKLNSQNLIVSIDNKTAILSAIAKVLPKSELENLKQTSSDKRVQKYAYTANDVEAIDDNIDTYLSYVLDENNKIDLAWIVNFGTNHKNYWEIEVSAVSGKVIRIQDRVLHCSFGKGGFLESISDEEIHSEEIHNHSNSNQRTEGAPSAAYRVFPFSKESPIYTPRLLIKNPSDDIASPFGWHDANGQDGIEFTITRGNNVYAYADKAGNNKVTPGSPPDGGANLNFDFPLDFSKRLDTLDNSKAVITQLFYSNNVIHDILFNNGFTDANRNFQAKNYASGNTATEKDFIWAEAHDGAGENNASFYSAVDGSNSPVAGGRSRMQMYMWSDISNYNLILSRPSGIIDTLRCGTQSDWGVCNFDITGAVKNAFSGSVSLPSYVCSAVSNSAEISGKIAIIDRGDCDFSAKVYNAQQAGAIAAIVVNRQSAGDTIINMAAGTSANLVTIPAFFVTYADGQKIRQYIDSGNVIRMNKTSLGNCLRKDGSLENAFVAHEYAHGLSIRLTGTGVNCLNNKEQGGEGWSDFIALALTVKPSDNKNTARGVGNYVVSEPINGKGIRMYPYSYDMSINPLTYGSLMDMDGTPILDSEGEFIGYVPNSVEVHDMGEVWAVTLWDMYWNFIEAYGFNPDFYNGNSGNNKAIKLVIEGLKLQKCSPGFLDARNAILKADSIMNGYANKCLIWQSFARRGMGWSAIQGSSDHAKDQTEAFDMPPSCNSNPIPNFTLSDTSICLGELIQLTNTTTGNIDSLRWKMIGGSPVSSNETTSLSVNYPSAGEYFITLYIYKNSYIDSITKKVKVYNIPVITTNISSSTICPGSSVTLSASGASTYNWSNGANNAQISVSPTVNTVYKVVGKSNGCISDSVAVSIFLKTKPTVSINASSLSICVGETDTLTASGATSYIWRDGSTSNSIVVNPTVTSSYKVIGILNGCSSDSVEIQITVKPKPIVSISPTNTTICAGQSVTLTASGASSYVWSTGQSGNTIVVNPSVNSTYKVLGITNNCSSDSATAIVNITTTNPTVSITKSPNVSTICEGDSVTLTASGANNYTWSTGANTAVIKVKPTVNTNYIVTGSLTGCSSL